jgi:SpoIIAA-like
MIELIEGLPAPVVGMRAEGKVEKSDYERTVIPAVRAMLDAHSRVRLLYVLGDDFDGYSIAAMWEDTKLGVANIRSWERIACVTDADWVENAVKAFGWMIPGEVRAFDDDDLDQARAWITEGL